MLLPIGSTLLCIFCTIFLFFAKIEKMAPMNNDSDQIDFSDPVDPVFVSSVVHPECSVVDLLCHPDSVWFPSIGNIFLLLRF